MTATINSKDIDIDAGAAQVGDVLLTELETTNGPFAFPFRRDPALRKILKDAGAPRSGVITWIDRVPDEPSDVALTVSFGEAGLYVLTAHRERGLRVIREVR